MDIVIITNKFGKKFKTTREKAESMLLKGIIKQEDISEVESEPVVEIIVEEIIDPVINEVETIDTTDDEVETIEQLREQFIGKFKSGVPKNKKNDIEWIKSKLSSN